MNRLKHLINFNPKYHVLRADITLEPKERRGMAKKVKHFMHWVRGNYNPIKVIDNVRSYVCSHQEEIATLTKRDAQQLIHRLNWLIKRGLESEPRFMHQAALQDTSEKVKQVWEATHSETLEIL